MLAEYSFDDFEPLDKREAKFPHSGFKKGGFTRGAGMAEKILYPHLRLEISPT
jgi:hypothetical protein